MDCVCEKKKFHTLYHIIKLGIFLFFKDVIWNTYKENETDGY